MGQVILHTGFEWLCRGTSVSLAAWIGSLPFILWYFHIVTPISLFANLLVVPIAFFILAIALLSLLATPFLTWLAIVFNNANWLLAQLVLGIVQLFAQIPGGHFYVATPHWPEKLRAKITVLDLGAGAATHLQTGGANWLFDCGSERSYERVVREYLHWAGVNRLNGLVLTHGDSLHLGGAAELLHDFPRVRLIDNPAPDRSSVHRRLQRLFQERRVKPDDLAAGDDFPLVARRHCPCPFSATHIFCKKSGRSGACHSSIHCSIDVGFVHVGQWRRNRARAPGQRFECPQ